MNMFMEPRLKDAEVFLETCELGECVASSAEKLMSPEVSASSIGAVVEGNLMAFTPGTSAVVRQDVEDCLLLATLVANKKFDIESQNREWFNEYNDALLKLGWPVRNMEYRDYQSGGQNLSMDKLVLDMLASAIAAAALPGPVSARLIGTVTQMIKKLGQGGKALKLFEQQVMSQQGANFRVGTCHESDDGTVYITLSTVNFKVSSNMTSLLGFAWGHGEAQIYGSGRGLIFNRRHYEQVRDTVQDKLGRASQTAIQEFDI